MWGHPTGETSWERVKTQAGAGRLGVGWGQVAQTAALDCLLGLGEERRSHDELSTLS